MNPSNDPGANRGNPRDGWLPEVNQDEAILAQEHRIEREIAVLTHLVSDRMSLNCLLNEYPDEDQVYQSKIENDLMSRYDLLRRTRPDGNCFFRGFTFAYFEYLLSDHEEVERFYKLAETSRQELVDLGFPEVTIEDIHTTFMNILRSIKDGVLSKQTQLLDLFNEQSSSDYLVVFMRLLTSGHLQRNSEFFSYFLDGGISIKEFCSLEVEPMYKESDHIHIIALSEATKVGVCINYLDHGSGEKVTVHLFPEGCTPKIHLLYRPGHYDILYPRKN